jgi:predicted esterase
MGYDPMKRTRSSTSRIYFGGFANGASYAKEKFVGKGYNGDGHGVNEWREFE